MRYQRLIGTALLTAAFVALPSMEAWGQKDKKKEDGPAPGGATDSEKIPAGEYVGVLKTTPGSDRTFTVEIETTRLVPTGKGGGGKGGGGAQRALQIQAQLQQAEVQMAAARTPQARQQAMSRIRQLTGQLRGAIANLQRSGGGKGGGAPAGYRYDKSKVTVEFQASEKAKVRTMLLPETFDEKGNLKKYSKKELDELRGSDKSAVGYESALEKLEVGQTIKVTTAAVAKAAATKVDKDKDKEDPEMDEKHKQAKLIVVLKAADPMLAKGAPPKKKK
jgi:hypothetical protein